MNTKTKALPPYVERKRYIDKNGRHPPEIREWTWPVQAPVAAGTGRP